MSVMESFEHPRNVPSDESRPLFVQAFVDSMPLDVDALVKASRFKNSPLSSPVIDSPDAAKIRMNDMLSSLNLTGQNCRGIERNGRGIQLCFRADLHSLIGSVQLSLYLDDPFAVHKILFVAERAAPGRNPGGTGG